MRFQPISPADSLPGQFVRICGLLGISSLLVLAAAPVQDRMIVDFPIKGAPPMTAWMSGPVAEWEEAGRRSIHLPLQPLADFQRLVITLIFAEGPQKSVHVWWEADQPSPPVPLGANLAEGWPGWNQRSVVLPPELAAQGGMLVVMTGGSERTVHRLVVHLLEEGKIFTSGNRVVDDLHEFDARLLPTHELAGQSWQVPGDAWRGNLIEAYLQEQVESLRGGVEFGVEINPAPRRAVLRFSFHGPAGVRPSVWINGQSLEAVSVEIPSLNSPAYVEPGPGAEPLYAGWRNAWVNIPHGLLQPGDNSVLLSTGEEDAYIHHARLEMWFAAPLLAPATTGSFEDITNVLNAPGLPTEPMDSYMEPALPTWEAPTLPAAPSAATEPASALDPGSLFRTSFF